MLTILERIILKTALPLLVLWTFGDYDGVRCIKIEERNLKFNNKHRYYDVIHFLNYGIDDFDTHNRQCYLALLVYLNHYVNKDVTVIKEFSTNISRMLNVEFTSKFDSKTFMLHEKVKVWFKQRNFYNELSVAREANEIIEMGIKQYVWKTEKELELLVYYRNGRLPVKFKAKAFETCTDNLRHLALPTKDIGDKCSEEYSLQGKSVWSNGVFKKTEVRDFGALTFFLTDDEFICMQYPMTNEGKYLYIIKYLEQVLIDIIQGFNLILYQVNFRLPHITEVYEFPNDTSIQVELLIILRHLYLKVADTALDLYILFRKLGKESLISTQYRMLSVYFQAKWTSLFSDAPPIKRTSFQSFKTDAEENKDHTKENDTDLDNEIDNPFNEKRFEEFEKISKSRFYQDRRVQPSLIRFYSVYDSWNIDVPNETNINQTKVFLYDLNGILTIVKHYVYSLTVASLNTQKKNPFWDPGFINGCQGPHTGLLKTKLILGNRVDKKKLGVKLLDDFDSARIFFERFYGNIKPENVSRAVKIFG